MSAFAPLGMWAIQASPSRRTLFSRVIEFRPSVAKIAPISDPENWLLAPVENLCECSAMIGFCATAYGFIGFRAVAQSVAQHQRVSSYIACFG
jgi:hypothetical protein